MAKYQKRELLFENPSNVGQRFWSSIDHPIRTTNMAQNPCNLA